VESRTDVEKRPAGKPSQAAEPWGLEVVLELSDFEAVFVVPALEDEAEDVDGEEESEDEESED
jgi:hypothetical protein